MNLNHLVAAINFCNQGHLPFNLGVTRAFLFSKKWYPLRAVVIYAFELAGEEEHTTDRALVALVYLIPYTRVAEIEFQNNLPVVLNEQDLLSEVRLVHSNLTRLLGQ